MQVATGDKQAHRQTVQFQFLAGRLIESDEVLQKMRPLPAFNLLKGRQLTGS